MTCDQEIRRRREEKEGFALTLLYYFRQLLQKIGAVLHFRLQFNALQNQLFRQLVKILLG